MIIFIANHPFPDNSGFSNRCKNALRRLTHIDEVEIVCEKTKTPTFSIEGKTIPIHGYRLHYKSIERTNKKTYIPGLYELVRNLDLLLGFAAGCWKAIKEYNKKGNIRAYVVVSPLTVPLMVYLISFILPIKLEYLEFHDLEPETAMHLKGISNKSIVVRVEYFLEKLLCRVFHKIIVTNSIQKERLIKRTGQSENKFFILPNLHLAQTPTTEAMSLNSIGITKKRFVLAYSSSLSYEYTTVGVTEIIKKTSEILKKIPNFYFVVMGSGDGEKAIQECIEKHAANESVLLTGRIPNVTEVLKQADVAIIPWLSDVMTETILPTKLFEYMANGKAIIAPDFGEFHNLLTHKKNALLFQNLEEVPDLITLLYKDKSLKEELGKNAYTYYMKTINPSRIMEEFESFLNKKC